MEEFKVIGNVITYEGARCHVWRSHHPNDKASFAMSLMEKGMLAAMQDGEDSTGRQKGRALTAEEVAQKACDIADAAFNQFHDRGWMAVIPPLTAEQVEALLQR